MPEVRAGVAHAMALFVCTDVATEVVFCFCRMTCYRSVLQKLLRPRFYVVGKTRRRGERVHGKPGENRVVWRSSPINSN
jgi:hypothetical protein